ncbi:GNAT family N-acetyltransferase [Candidatus Eisenbacteria bacterium]|uniref:GNAT family N-acetyltransferase n=1 Tax=Eiseniibacteriota bacterium TaxID=2212470 RepID=A0ABV6YJ00_UNCEI
MTPYELTILQMELECIGLNGDGRLCRIPGDAPDDIHRLFVVHHQGRYSLFAREDVPADVLSELHRRGPAVAFSDTQTVCELLYGDRDKTCAWRGFAYTFPSTFRANPGNLVIRDGRFIVFDEGREVSSAWSSRANEKCAELATETVLSHRRRGLARRVSSAWALVQLAHARIPFYSHKRGNVASRGLALSLGVEQFMDCIAYE